MRTFADNAAVREEVPLLVGIVGCSSSGKTYSALRLATGMQRVIGGDIFCIDTEHNRALNYADIFKFRHIPFAPPFGSLDYLRSIEHCVTKGGKIIVVDSMTHEHSGEGGYLWAADQFIEQQCKRHSDMERWKVEGKYSRSKWIAPAAARKELTNGIVQMGINGIFCYRAQEKLDDDFKPLGWEPETTSRLIYEMQQQFLLLPGSDGIPKFNDATASEKKLIKTPAQFRGWFAQGQRLDEEMGQKMALWAAGKSIPEGQPKSPPGSGAASLVGAAAPVINGKKPSFAEFLQEMGALKAKNEKVYYGVLGANGVEHANQLKSLSMGLRIKGEVEQAIKEATELSPQQPTLEPGWNG